MKFRKAWFTVVHVAYDLFLKLNPRKLAAHAVMTNDQGQVLMLRGRFADNWTLPGGGLDRRENLDTAVLRECREELNVEISVGPMTGMYFYADISAYVAIFRCRIVQGDIKLSHEHTEYRWAAPADLPPRMRQTVEDAFQYDGQAALRTFA